MNAICYENTKTTIPNFVSELHKEQSRGYAYETKTHFIHLYGSNKHLYMISQGLTVVEAKKDLKLHEWVEKTFGAKNIKKIDLPVGEVIKSIWRPGLYHYKDIHQLLTHNDKITSHSNQSLIILLQKLNDLFLYIHPADSSLNTYSHKTRELLLLSATEFESQCTSLLKEWGIKPQKANYNTADYIKVKNHGLLSKYAIIYKNTESRKAFKPFEKWKKTNPTKSLKWYDAYNKTKHNQHADFDKATLSAVLNSIAANVIMYIVRFGPFELLNGSHLLSTYINQLLEIELINVNPQKFYIPLILLPDKTRDDLFIFDPNHEDLVAKWKINKRKIN